MSPVLKEIFAEIELAIQAIQSNEFLLSAEDEKNLHAEKVNAILKRATADLKTPERERIYNEIFSWGPLNSLMAEEQITEIMVNGGHYICYEKGGRLHSFSDFFLSENSYRNFVDRLCHASNTFITREHPCGDGQFGEFRLSLVGDDVTQAGVSINLRRHPKSPWTFDKLVENKWCSPRQADYLRKMRSSKVNFLVVGSTGAGKTSVLNSFLSDMPTEERLVVIEDTPEIHLPNKASLRMVTRDDPQGILPPIDQGQLVKRSLRLRPDRIVMGEMRGAEAKDFLLALATGHDGSFGTLHAQNAAQALIRLEMLIQIGAPQWNLLSIRRLVQISLQYIVVTKKNSEGHRCLEGIYRLSSLEQNGFLLEPIEF
jgi:pilus assembly protein CpaF